MRRSVALVVALAASLSVGLAGQSTPSQDPPIFRRGTEAVRLDAFVTDRRGRAVPGLTADDFEIYEDGRWQDVQLFAPVELPLPTRQRANTSIRDIAVNDDEQDRIYVIVFDSLSWPEASRATRILQRFLDNHFGDSDLAALVTLDRSGAMQFTNNRARLMAQAGAFMTKYSAFTIPVGQRFSRRTLVPTGMPSADSLERANTFGQIAAALGHINARRKSILFISGRLEFDPYDAVDMPKSSFAEHARLAMEPIMAGNLTVYPIYPGVAGPMELRNMRALAYVTGATPIGSDIDKGLRQIVDDNSIYYVLGYESTNRLRDGGYRRIKVRMKRKELQVRARQGYFVEFPPDDPDRLVDWSGRMPRPRALERPSDSPPELARAVASPVALTAVPMKVFAAPHSAASRAGVVSVVIELPPSSLSLTDENGRLTGTVDVAVGGTMGAYTVRSTQFTYEVRMEGEERDRLLRNGLRLTSDVTLGPGDYRLSVAASTGAGRVGTVLYDLTVPDFNERLLMMSGVSLTSATAGAIPTLRKGERVALPTPVTAAREFQRSDTVSVYVEVYENVWWTDADHTITVVTELRDGNGRVIPMTSTERPARDAQRTTGDSFVAALPLIDIPPGPYTLRVQARSTYGPSRAVTRDVEIVVR
jgi:VWFA-related protein